MQTPRLPLADTPAMLLLMTSLVTLAAPASAATGPELSSMSLVSPLLIVGALAAVAGLVGLWWYREKHTSEQRRSMRAFHALSEEIIAAHSPAEIAEKLSSVLPAITQATAARLYLLNKRTKSLEYVPTDADPEPMALGTDAVQQEGLSGAVVLCFRNRTLLNVPDVRRSPFAQSAAKPGSPRSAMFLPLFAQSAVLGVLEVDNADKLGYFSPEEQSAAQHVANQVAASLKLQEQNSLREQLFRGEKLAATGQLISGVASELQTPIGNILQLSASLSAHGVPDDELKQLETESHRVAEIVSRLVSFAHPDDSEIRPVDIHALLASLMKFREPEWKTLELRVLNRVPPEPCVVLGAPGQVEQVFLNLLVHAEQRASESVAKTMSVSSHRMGSRAAVDISYTLPASSGDESDAIAETLMEFSRADGDSLSLGVCQGIIKSNGGELRLRSESGTAHFEVELPSAPVEEKPGQPRPAARVLTLMLVEPEESAQRHTLGLLASRGHRVIPVAAEEAADLAQRLRFDAILWALRPGGSKWGDFQERLRNAVPSFILMTEGYDAQLARSLEESGGFLLSRPVQEAELDRILAAVDTRSLSAQSDRPPKRD